MNPARLSERVAKLAAQAAENPPNKRDAAAFEARHIARDRWLVTKAGDTIEREIRFHPPQTALDVVRLFYRGATVRPIA